MEGEPPARGRVGFYLPRRTFTVRVKSPARAARVRPSISCYV